MFVGDQNPFVGWILWRLCLWTLWFFGKPIYRWGGAIHWLRCVYRLPIFDQHLDLRPDVEPAFDCDVLENVILFRKNGSDLIQMPFFSSSFAAQNSFTRDRYSSCAKTKSSNFKRRQGDFRRFLLKSPCRRLKFELFCLISRYSSCAKTKIWNASTMWLRLFFFSRCVFLIRLRLLPHYQKRYIFNRATKQHDTFLSINCYIILLWSGLAGQLLFADINTIKGWWSANSQLIWLQ